MRKSGRVVGIRNVLAAGVLGAVVAFSNVGCSGMKPGDVHAVTPVNTQTARAGNVYLLRGFIGIFSTGIDDLGKEIGKQGVAAQVFQDDQWSSLAGSIRKKYRNASGAEPLVLVGHSYGADDVVRIARELKRDNIEVDLIVTLDPVTPPNVPSNVRRCVNLYQSNGVMDNLPWLRGIPLAKEKKDSPTELVNANIRVDRKDLLEPGVDHFNIEKKPKIHKEVIAQVLAACPTRDQWTSAISRTAVPASSKLVIAPVSPTLTSPLVVTISRGGFTTSAAPTTQPIYASPGAHDEKAASDVASARRN